METPMRRSPDRGQMFAMLFGAVFLAVGILGFIPGITTNYDQLGELEGEGAKLLGIFGVNWLHNVAHALIGLVGLAMAAGPRSARVFLIGGGLVYAGLFAYGVGIDLASGWNFVGLNDADNVLHGVLALAMLMVGFGVGSAARGELKPPYRRAA